MKQKIKLTEIGRIPEDWNIAILRNICVQHNGIQTGPFGSQLHQKDYKSVGTPIITVEHLGENRIIHENIPYVSDDDKERLSRYTLKIGDIVFSRVGSVDRRVLVREAEDGWLFSGRCLRVRPNPNLVDSEYLSWFFGLPAFKEHIRKIAVGATMPSLNTELLSNVKVVLPPLVEQRSVASILGSLDDKIALNRSMNSTLEAIGQALFKHWFVDFEFPNEEGKPYRSSGGEMVETELGEVPRDWSIRKIGDLVAINEQGIDKQHRHDVIEYIDISSVTVGRLTETKIYALKDAPSRARRIVRHGDTIWSTVRPNLKSFLYIDSPPENLVVSTGFAVLTPKKIPSTFLYYWVTTEDFVNYLSYSADGSAYPAVNTAYIANAVIIFPSGKVLTAFDDVVSPMRDQIAYNENQSRILAAIRDALLPKLMSGEIRIKNERIKND